VPAAIVTGASGAIGGAIAARAARRGYAVVLSGRDAARLQATADAIRGDAGGGDAGPGGSSDAGATVRVVPGDLREPGAPGRLVAAARGLGPLGLVVHAAGDFAYGPLGPDLAAPSQAVLDGHLGAATALLAAAAEDLTAGSTVIVLGSLAARRAFPYNAAYVAAKHGLAGLTGAFSAEQRARGVRVTLLSPGFVTAGATLEMGATEDELAGFLTPEDVADAAEYVLTLPEHVCLSELELRPVRPTRFD
jgi:NADP-dependent 3-hydroxy acid dehydrogenase YdfG